MAILESRWNRRAEHEFRLTATTCRSSVLKIGGVLGGEDTLLQSFGHRMNLGQGPCCPTARGSKAQTIELGDHLALTDIANLKIVEQALVSDLSRHTSVELASHSDRKRAVIPS